MLVSTAGGEDSGTAGQVTLNVFGERGETGALPLGEPGKGLFQPGQTDEFDVSIRVPG